MKKILLGLIITLLSTTKSFADDVNGLFSINNSNIGGICIYLGGADVTGNASSAFAVNATTTTQNNTTELYFATATVNASTLINTNSYLLVEAAGTIAHNTDAKVVQIEANTSTSLSATTTDAVAAVAGNDGWKIRSTISRTSTNNQVWGTDTSYGAATVDFTAGGKSTLTETSAITLAVTGKEATTNTVGDISFLYMKMWLCPNVQ